MYVSLHLSPKTSKTNGGNERIPRKRINLWERTLFGTLSIIDLGFLKYGIYIRCKKNSFKEDILLIGTRGRARGSQTQRC